MLSLESRHPLAYLIGELHALDRTEYSQSTDMSVFTTHVVCHNDDLKYVRMHWLAGDLTQHGVICLNAINLTA
jgi:hypothetical protein